ncbi:MAG: GtrA family protein [Clostridiales bacterium]|jgi:putative flippase GtrA|nr:GtrA family protein [Clostridiales bacterium]
MDKAVKGKFIKEKVLYLLFGGLTTLVNFSAYYLFVRVLRLHYIFGNTLAWLLSVLFAYVTNRNYVFDAPRKPMRARLGEMAGFFCFRGLTGLIDTAALFVLVTLLSANDFAAKIAVNVIVVILNYLFSKLIIFRQKKEGVFFKHTLLRGCSCIG